jgi:hypothetical protein
VLRIFAEHVEGDNIAEEHPHGSWRMLANEREQDRNRHDSDMAPGWHPASRRSG